MASLLPNGTPLPMRVTASLELRPAFITPKRLALIESGVNIADAFGRTVGYLKTKKQIGHHARPSRASATAPLLTGADTCKVTS